MTRRRLPK